MQAVVRGWRDRRWVLNHITIPAILQRCLEARQALITLRSVPGFLSRFQTPSTTRQQSCVACDIPTAAPMRSSTCWASGFWMQLAVASEFRSEMDYRSVFPAQIRIRILVQAACVHGPPRSEGAGDSARRGAAASLPAPARSCRAAAGRLARVRRAARPLERAGRGRRRAKHLAGLRRSLPLAADAPDMHCHPGSLAMPCAAQQVPQNAFAPWLTLHQNFRALVNKVCIVFAFCGVSLPRMLCFEAQSSKDVSTLFFTPSLAHTSSVGSSEH